MNAELYNKLDLPIHFKADLDASGQVRYFGTAGIDAKSGIDTQYQIDRTALYTAFGIQMNLMATDGTPIGVPNPGTPLAGVFNKIAKAIRYTFAEIYLDGKQLVWYGPLSLFMTTPMDPNANAAVAAINNTNAGYDLFHSLTGIYKLNEPLNIEGGVTITAYQKWNVADVADLSGITCEMILRGIKDRTIQSSRV